jgi:hypothetical protein
LPSKVYKGHDGYCSLVFEVVADYDLWIWHAFFGMQDNDINTLQRFLLFARLAEFHAP